MECLSKKCSVKIYDLAVVLMTIKVMLDKLVYINNHGIIDNSLIVLGIGLFLVSFIFETKHTLVEYIIVGFTGLLCLYASLKMDEFYLLMTFFLVIAAINKDLAKTVRLMRGVKSVIVAVSVLWYVVALFVFRDTLYIIVRDGRIAHHFGFSHPNAFALIVGWILLETLYLSYGKYKNWMYVLYPVAGIVLYFFTCCDTIMYIMFAVTILLVLGRIKSLQNLIHITAQYIFPIIAIVNAFCIRTYMNRSGFLYEPVRYLDAFLTARIKQAAYIMEHYGTTFFGQEVPMGEKIAYDTYYRLSTVMCDGLYSYLLVCLGWVFTLIISFVIWNCVRKKKEYSVIAIIYAIYGILETHGSNAFMVYPIFLFAAESLTQLHNKLRANYEEMENNENHTGASSGTDL
ncbi:MAG: hypothetical protein IJ274_04555 [Lachnospiraceae bacterium]|nr:hypothetical protein [Lachnospiraceae bacterium]